MDEEVEEFTSFGESEQYKFVSFSISWIHISVFSFNGALSDMNFGNHEPPADSVMTHEPQ